MLKDTYKHKGLRRQLVRELERKGVNDPQLLEAFERVPRHFFVDDAFAEAAYEDRAFPIGEGQTISQPFTVAYQTRLLEIEEGDKVLEVGTGSGYQACILAEMGAKVYTIERNKILYDRTRKLLRKMGYYQIKPFFGDGYKGLPSYAPFDKIIVTAGATSPPLALLEQLKVGGFLVIPVGGPDLQKMKKITRVAKDHYETEDKGQFRFVPMKHGKDF